MAVMSVLIAYATHSGATETLAETMRETLAAAGITAEKASVDDDPDPSRFDAVIIGSGIRVEAVEKTFVTWVKEHSAALADRPVAFFTCSGSASDPKKEGRQKGADSFLRDAAFTPVATRNFPGWVIMDRIPMHERVLLKSMRTPTGDFRDLDAVAAWTREIAPLLTA
jgi:menaquinone-dependent protoporphyrinogen oxidase